MLIKIYDVQISKHINCQLGYVDIGSVFVARLTL
ncbi:MAG: hypothetical protein DID91_2727703132 [Candidatus Nitrotoga sp. MKT]|nr:MAG: hypothetical protein DID91_2727703132 [Candidatus Nitrotoga sp. MKT]